MNNKEIRVRFAPSPTGPLHIGGVRTALYNYLFARNRGGKMILRIEDTDQKRYVEGAEKYIMESLKWCGIEIDEGVEQGGGYGPYRQSERKDIYRQYADKLIENGYAYYAFDSAEELGEMRKRLETEKASNKSYSPISRMGMKNSLTLSKEEVRQKIGSGEDFVIRYKMLENEEVRFQDMIRGEVVVNTSTLDDKVLFKSDGMPTYHLANIVDDHLMEISHVIRGEEWLPSLPLHVLLYKALGWNSPEFAHLPLILKPNGKGKLSKRDGDKGGFPVFPIEWNNANTHEVFSGFRESGYFQEAFVNIIAFLGWNPGTEKEIFSMGELIKAFDLERVGKAGARFDPEKARWFNHQHLQLKPDDELAGLFQDILSQKGIDVSRELVVKVVSLVKERANFVNDFWEQASFFFEAPQEYDAKMVKKRWKENTPEILNKLILSFGDIETFDSGNLEAHIKNFLEKNELGMGQVMTALRLTLVGSGRGPGAFEIMELLGKEEIVRRIERAINEIRK